MAQVLSEKLGTIASTVAALAGAIRASAAWQRWTDVRTPRDGSASAPHGASLRAWLATEAATFKACSCCAAIAAFDRCSQIRVEGNG